MIDQKKLMLASGRARLFELLRQQEVAQTTEDDRQVTTGQENPKAKLFGKKAGQSLAR